VWLKDGVRILERVNFGKKITGGSKLFGRKITQALTQAQGKPTTPAQIARHMGLAVQHLRKSPRIHSLLVIWEKQHKRAVAQFNEQREQELVRQVEHIIKYLILRREPVTQQRVAQILGMSYQGLRIYPRVEALLMKVNINFHLTKQRSHLDGSLERRKAILSI
jgi:hypothetical protein